MILLLKCVKRPIYLEYKYEKKLDMTVNDVLVFQGKDKDGIFVRDALGKLMFVPYGTFKFRVKR